MLRTTRYEVTTYPEESKNCDFPESHSMEDVGFPGAQHGVRKHNTQGERQPEEVEAVVPRRERSADVDT